MFTTKSPFLMAPATDRPVLIVSHGSPSDPEPQEASLNILVERVRSLAPEMVIRGATLAATGALEKAVQGLENPIICPWFMADGWFVSTNLPRRLLAAGLAEFQMTRPLGLFPNLSEAVEQRVRLHMGTAKLPVGDTVLILAAHGSPSNDRPRLATEALAAKLAATDLFYDVRPCYVDQAPFIADSAVVSGPALVLPFFAARAGHVTDDLPQALQSAGFTGPVLDPIGLWTEIPALLIEELSTIAETCAA